ncbi:hypothetical protein OsI_12858 [Oryza sativa Indica Group]|uniref:Uncharacterized protein n=2 Tax=Oryza sativa TaxID=4530 RepID=B9FA45_ORYSJ|nr:hypothetical protein OsI_12858 [Oryza sativa Indica Group]EEE59623.1 hypothetical protein OsJ_11960 [Oryza sativa Japonica Group]
MAMGSIKVQAVILTYVLLAVLLHPLLCQGSAIPSHDGDAGSGASCVELEMARTGSLRQAALK